MCSQLTVDFVLNLKCRFSVDFGKNELEILRWLVNHLEPSKAENLLELLDGNQFKVVYQPYDWAPNV